MTIKAITRKTFFILILLSERMMKRKQGYVEGQNYYTIEKTYTQYVKIKRNMTFLLQKYYRSLKQYIYRG